MLVYSATGKSSETCYSNDTGYASIHLEDASLTVELFRDADSGAEGATDGATVDSSLAGKALMRSACHVFSLQDMRKRAAFRDFSLFGLNMYTGAVVPFSSSKYAPLDKFGALAVKEGCPVRIIFPDTESTLREAVIIVITEFGNRRIPTFCNVPPDGVYSNADKADKGNLFLLKRALPAVRLSGPASMPADSRAELVLNFESDARGVDSLCDFVLDTESGYLPKRKIRAGVGDAVSFPVHSTGLSAGDVMEITCGFVQFDRLATHNITITE